MLTGISAGSIVFRVVFLPGLQRNEQSRILLVLGLVGLALTLFLATGIQFVASAADRWGEGTISPALLVWEWRILTATHLAFLLNNLPVTYEKNLTPAHLHFHLQVVKMEKGWG
jgi:hypothetical protein